MDKYNTFHSRSTYQLMRLDYLAVLLLLIAAVLFHADEVNWVAFIIAFAWIDLVGTLPAWFVYYKRRAGQHRTIPTIFYNLYNFCHSLAVNVIVFAVWYAIAGAWDWAMLAGFIHILGDRAVYGNVYKPKGLSFEPVAHGGYSSFLSEYERTGQW